MSMRTTRWVFSLLALSLVGGCGGGGGSSGGGINPPPAPPPAVPVTKANEQTFTTATTASNGAYSRVDVIDGGNPDGLGSVDQAKRALLKALSEQKTDLNNQLPDNNNDGVPEVSGLEPYHPGFKPDDHSQLIFAANNVYDLLQTDTGSATIDGKPNVALLQSLTASTWPGFNGGDLDGDGVGDGGPGLYSNIPNGTMPTLPVLPNTMGDAQLGGSGRGPSPTDQHQFIQIVFPYNLDKTSLFKVTEPATSFLGDSDPGATPNVFIEARSIQKDPPDTVNAIDQSSPPQHVHGVAVIGGVTAVPTSIGGSTLATIDPFTSNVPLGARALLMQPNVFTYIAHEDPLLIVTAPSQDIGQILPSGQLVLPDPTTSAGGGRVFGGNVAIPGSVNDFATDGDTNAAAIGFMSVQFTRVRSGNTTLKWPYFHTFPVSQANVGGDPRGVNASFNRGPAIFVNPFNAVPSIDILDIDKDAIKPYNPDVANSDTVNTISTRARFLVQFDKEVVPNSVGFSRRYTLHSTDAQGVILPFEGNSKPVPSDLDALVSGALGAPVAPSIYLAVNQKFPKGANKNQVPGSNLNGFVQNVNSPFAKSQFQSGTFDDGTAFTTADKSKNGLNPQQQNSTATLPRGVVPCDIYPVNQNNLQAYVVEPLVELPPSGDTADEQTYVTLGVCMPGLGLSNYDATSQGNYTHSGTVFTSFQGLTPVGLGDTSVTQKVAIIGNQTIIKVNAGPMDMQGLLFYGGTDVAVDRLVNGDHTGQTPANPDDDLTTGGFNMARTFHVGKDNEKRYVNAPVAPQAIYLGFATGGAGVLDLAGTGYNTNVPGGAALNTNFKNYLEVTRYLPVTLTGQISNINWSGGSVASGGQSRGFGIMGRYTSGGSAGTPSGVESELALGAAIITGQNTPTPGINEGSSGFETLVMSAPIHNNASTASPFLAPMSIVGITRDIEVGDFLDTIYFDRDNPYTEGVHKTYSQPTQNVDTNTISDPPLPNPPPLRFPVGLPHTDVVFDQSDLAKPPFIIDGNEVYCADVFETYNDGTAVTPNGGSRNVNTFLQLNPTSNTNSSVDLPMLPKPGFTNPFTLFTTPVKFVQTGPQPRTSTAGAMILTSLNSQVIPGGPFNSQGLVPGYYQSRQQIGNYLFMTDGLNKKLHVLNSNNMEVLQSLALPDPYGLGITPDLQQIFVSNQGDNSVSIVDADPLSPTFMTELKRTPVGINPRAVAVDPNNEDAFILCTGDNTISIVDRTAGVLRKTLASQGLNQPFDIAIGMRESGLAAPGFQSGTFHAFISNSGANNVLVYQSGPSGQAGIGFDNIVGPVTETDSNNFTWPNKLVSPKGVVLDANAKLDGLGKTLGCFVAHKNQAGKAVASRITYTKDDFPGIQTFNTLFNPGFGSTVFEVTAQYASTFNGQGLDVALPDYNRQRFEQDSYGTYWALFNAGAMTKTLPSVTRNGKYTLRDVIIPVGIDAPVWEPDRLYLSIGNNAKLIDVFNITSGVHLNTITAPQDVSVMSTYFSQ